MKEGILNMKFPERNLSLTPRTVDIWRMRNARKLYSARLKEAPKLTSSKSSLQTVVIYMVSQDNRND